ncbi:SDR family oxidoreductase [Neobacillus niacini]|uniref:SDR family oxidoreductase n=1 Tax=Neobacillus niacini TaxID=86668 RepID=UPI002FFDE6CC
MNLGLQNKVAIVSGGSKGIGKATAMELAKEGALVVIVARTTSTLGQTKAEIEKIAPSRVIAVKADMTNRKDVCAVIRETHRVFGTVDIAISNIIGHVIDPEEEGPHAGNFEETEPVDFFTEYRRLVLSAWYLANEASNDMKQNRWGRIINIGSRTAKEPVRELPHILPNVARPAVVGLHRVLADKLAPFQITVNSVLTGNILTERNQAYFSWLAKREGSTLEDILENRYQTVPLKRPGDPIEEAALIAYLCSEKASLITGQAIPVDGGVGRSLI